MLDSEKKVITDYITDISTKSDGNHSNTSSDTLASVKAALLLTLANSTEPIKQLRILIVRRKRTVDDLLKQADGDWTKSKFAGGNIRVRSPHGVPYIKQLPLREQQSVFSCDQAALRMVQSVYLSVCHTFWLCFHHRIITKFSGVITNDRSDVHAKDQGHRSKVKVKVREVMTQLSRFRTVTPVWIYIWWWNDA